MAIKEFAQAIEAGAKNGTLVVDSAAMAAGEMTGVFDRVFGSHRFEVSKTVLKSENGGFAVTGRTSLRGFGKIAVTIVYRAPPEGDLSFHFRPDGAETWAASRAFAELKGTLFGRLQLSGPEVVITGFEDATLLPSITIGGALEDIGLPGVDVSQVWPTETYTLNWHAPRRLAIPGISGLSIENFNVVLATDGPAGGVTGAVGCEIHAGKLVLPLTMPVPTGGAALRLRGDFDPVALPGPADLVALLGTDAFERSLPENLRSFAGFSIDDFEMLLNPRNGAVPYVSLSLQSSQTWQIIPNGLALGNVAFHVTVLSPITSDRALTSSVSGNAKISDLDVFLTGEFGDGMVLFGMVDEAKLSHFVSAILHGIALPDALLDVALRDATFSLSSSGDFSVESRGVEFEFHKLAGALSIPLPAGFADFSLDSLAFEVTGADNSWTLKLSSDQPVSFPDNADSRLTVSGFRVVLQNDGRNATTAECGFELTGWAKPSDDISLTLGALTCIWSTAHGAWKVEGEARAEIYSHSYALTAEIGSSTFRLTYAGDVELCRWQGVGHARIKTLSFALQTDTQGRDKGESGDSPTQPSAGHTFGVSGSVEIAVDGLLEVAADLRVVSSDGARKLVIAAEAPKIAPIRLPVAVPPPVVHIEAKNLLLAYGRDEGDDKASWTLGGAAGVWFTDIPGIVEKYFPAEGIDGSLRVGSQGVKITCSVPDELQPDFPPLALTFANDYRLELGQPGVRIETIAIALGSKDPELGATLHVTVPSELNCLLGWDKSGRPTHVFLNESFDLRLSLAKHPALALTTSPFKALRLYEKNGKTWSDWAFGDFAQFSFQTPEFSFADGRWQGSAALERHGDLGLPLAPVKFALGQLGLAAIGDGLPEAIKLKEIDFDKDDPYRRLEELLDADGLNPDLRKILSKLVGVIESVVDHLPEDFREYLTFGVPKSLDVAFGVGGDGATTLAIATEDDTPLKILLPTLSTFGPALIGITFHTISLGQMLGGSLAVLEMDGYIDQFDLPMLLLAPGLPDKAALGLRNRFTVTETLAVAPTGLPMPMPIPLFYKELAWDLNNALGLQLSTHWSYPKPDPSIFGLITLFEQLKDFFTQADYLLHDQKPPENLKLEFTVGRNLITLPSYLGGAGLGRNKPLPRLDVYKSTARLLDAMKTGNAGYLIEAIPLRHEKDWYRIGKVEVRFGPVVLLEAGWCITTEKEFRTEVLPKEGALVRELAGGDADDALLALPERTQGQALDKGFIVLLMGGAGIDHVLSGRIRFGIAVTRPDSGEAPVRLQTGFQWELAVADTLKIKVGGTLAAQKDEVAIAGKAGLYLDGNTLVESKAGLRVRDDLFEAALGFAIADCLDINGTLRIDAAGITLAGDFAWHYGSGATLSQAKVTAILGPGGLTIALTGAIFENACSAQITVGGPQKIPQVKLAFHPSDALQADIQAGLAEMGEEIAAEVERLGEEIGKTKAEGENLKVTVTGLAAEVARWLDGIATYLDSKNHIETQVSSNAGKYIDGLSWAKRQGAKIWWSSNKGKVLAAARKEANDNSRTLRNQARALRESSPETAKDQLIRTLQDIRRAYDPYTFSFKSGWVKHTHKEPMPAAVRKQIADAIDTIGKLDANRTYIVEKAQLQEAERRRQSILDRIARDIEDKVADAAPRLEGIFLETSLGVLAPTQSDLVVRFHHRHAPHDLKVDGDLTDLAGVVKAGLKRLVTSLAKH